MSTIRNQLRYHVETPGSFFSVTKNRRVIVKGWCFSLHSKQSCQIVIRLGSRLIACHSEDRPDIKERFNGDDNFPIASGFIAEFKVGRGFKLLHIDAQGFSGETLSLGRRLILSKFPRDITDYPSWIKQFDGKHTPEKCALIKRLKEHSYMPLISIILSVHKPSIKYLTETFTSVYQQVYTHWELQVAYDHFDDPAIEQYLKQQQRRNRRVTLCIQAANRDSATTANCALHSASGDYIAFLGDNDILAPHALAWAVDALNENLNLDILYSDEDKVDSKGKRYDPYFKPDWNPDLLLSQNYLGHFVVIRKRIIDDLNGFRKGLEGEHEWDLVLRAVELTESARIRHIPVVLYHTRISKPIEKKTKEEHKLAESRKRVLVDYLTRNTIPGDVVTDKTSFPYIQYHLTKPLPRVSIVIPTKDHVNLLKTCVNSVLNKTNYPDYTIMIVDNDSEQRVSINDFEPLKGNTVKIVKVPGSFNFSRIVNRGVSDSSGDLLALLNNDTEVISSNWLTEMVSHALRPGVGVVGAKLYYPNGKIQHAGVILGIGGVAGHAFRNLNKDADGHFRRLKCIQNYCAVTGACMVFQRSLFEEVGGFNEEDLAVAFNDVDFCLRIRAMGYRNVFTPFAELYHHEAYSRGPDRSIEKQSRFQQEFEYMKRTWGELLDNDPAYSLNLSLANENFDLASPPRSVWID